MSTSDATLVGAGIGAIGGFLTVLGSTWLNDRRKRERFLVGLTRDVERCHNLSLTTDRLPELLNPITFPFIRDMANGSYVHLFSAEERGTLMNIHYLIENFLRYQDPEIQIFLDWIRDPENSQTLDRWEMLQNTAIASLESSLHTYAENAHRLLNKHRHLRDKPPRWWKMSPQLDSSNNQGRIPMTPVSLSFPSFNKQLADRLAHSGFTLNAYGPLWLASENVLVIKGTADEVLRIDEMTKEVLEAATSDAVEHVFQCILKWDCEGRGRQTEGDPADVPDQEESATTVASSAFMLAAHMLGWLFRKTWIIKVVGRLWNQPWLVVGGTYLLWRLRDQLPLISNAYVLSGVAGALLVASVGVPLLKTLQPTETMQSFFGLPIMRAGVLIANDLSLDYVNHPEVIRVSEAAIRQNSVIAGESAEKTLSHSRWSIVAGLAAFMILPWISSGEAFVRWMCLFVPIGFAVKAIEEQWCMLLVKVMIEFFTNKTGGPQQQVHEL